MAEKLKKKTAYNRSFVHFLFDMCFTYSDIFFLAFLIFWIYSDARTDFQVLAHYFPFCKKILSVFGSSFIVSSFGPIEKLYPMEEGLQPLCQALVYYYKKIKQKSGLHQLNQILGCSQTGELSAAMTWPMFRANLCIVNIH